MTFKIYLLDINKNVAEIDLSNYIVGDANLQIRNDYAFAEGGLNLFFDTYPDDRLKRNIPPFTICLLEDKYFVCSSVCRYYQPQKKNNNNQSIQGTYHEVKILEFMALCECFIIGCKTESNYHDYQSIEQIFELINNKYSGYNFSYYSSDYSLLNDSHDYTFHAGTTLFDVLKEYGKRNSVKFYIYSITRQTTSPKRWNIVLRVYRTTTYTSESSISPTNPLSLSLEQNVDNYCNQLETIQSNVVDRNNSNRWIDMTCRTSTAGMTANSAEILLPTDVESISEFVVNGSITGFTEVRCPDIITPTWIMANGGTQIDDNNYRWVGTYQALIDTNTSYGGHSNIFDWLANGFKTASLLSTQFTIDVNTSGVGYYSCSREIVSYNYANWFDYLMEETEWNTLSVYIKPKYAVYKSGTNRIYNLNASYQADIIHQLIGQTTYNFLQSNEPINNAYLDDNNYIYRKMGTNDYDPTHHSYTISGVPVVDNLIVRDTKIYEPFNENKWKTIGRTYQNSANPVDFESLIKDMKQQNRVLGTNELSYEILVNDILDSNKNYMISASNLGLGSWYVNSLIYNIKPSAIVLTVNCSKEPQKIADVIGVEYQYNPMELATENIVVRPLYYELTHTNTYNAVKTNYLSGLDTFLLVISSNGSTPIHQVAVRTTIFVDADENYYLYASMLDNYSAGKQSINVQASNYEIRDIPYCDDDYRFENIAISLVCMQQSLPQSFSEKMPNISALDLLDVSCDVYSITDEDTIYKDERETLAFTIKLVKP